VCIVALFYGQSKPDPVEDFTNDFVNEVLNLQANGFSANEKRRHVVLHFFICDAPAIALLKNIKAHNSLFGSERCTAKGTSFESCTTYVDPACFEADKRSGQVFVALGYFHNHQNGVAAISAITDDCISRSAFGYMHLVCLGAVRRMIGFWKKGDRVVRLGSRHLMDISERLVALRDFVQSENNAW
jgi:hypothetical protein